MANNTYLFVKHRTFIVYAAIGLGAVAIDVGLFALLEGAYGVNALMANSASTFVALVYSFLANAFLNFRVWNRLALRFASFTVVTFCGWVVSTAMLWFLAEVMGFDAVVIKVLSLPVVLLLQYVLNSKITFAETDGSATPPAVPATAAAAAEGSKA
jgi:putative flippase GtrA